MIHFKPLRFTVFVALLSAAVPCGLHAQTLNWTTGTALDASGAWNATTFNGQAYTAANALVIDGSATKTITLSGTITTPLSLTVSGTGISGTTVVSSASVAGAGAITLTGSSISGTLAKTGSAELILSSANAFGAVSISGGKFFLNSAAGLGTTGTLTVQAGAANGVSGSYATGTVTGTGTPDRFFFDSSNLNASYTFSKNIAFDTVASATTYGMVMRGGSTRTTTLTGNITGASNVTLRLDTSSSGDASSIWRLSGDNSGFAGNIRLNRGRLQLDSAAAAGTGTISIGTNASTLGNLFLAFAGTLTNAVTIINSGNTISTGTNDVTLSGVVTTNSSTTEWAKTATTGKLTLTHPSNAITGPTVITDGTLSIAGAGRISSGTYASAITLTAATSVLDYASSTSQAISGSINGPGMLTKSGTSILTLSGSNGYNGTTTVSGGVLVFGTTASFYSSNAGVLAAANAALLTVQSGGTASFAVGGVSDFTNADITTLLGASSGATGFRAGAFLGLDTTSASFTYSDNLADTNGGTQSLGLAKTGTNTLTITGANTYTGGTAIYGGILSLGSGGTTGDTSNVNALGTGTVTINSGGTLRLWIQNTGSYTIANSVILNGGTLMGEDGIYNMTGTVQVGAAGGTFRVRYSTKNLTLSNVISGAGPITISAQTDASAQVIFAGANTFTGPVTVASGTLSVTSLNSVVGGTASSSLGAPTTVAAGTINMGNLTQTPVLRYSGTGETTDRVINLGGTTGGATINHLGTGLLKFTSNFTATGSGSKLLSLSGTGVGEIAGAIVDNSSTNKTSLTKSAAGTWKLSGANTYTGVTTVSAGILQFTKQVSLYNNTPASWTAANFIVSSGGIAAFNVGGTGEFTATDIATLAALTNVVSGTAATQGFRSGSILGLDTTNAAGGIFTYGTALADHVAGTTTDTLGLRKIGSGTLQLTATNTYTGGTTVDAGTLELMTGGSTGAIRGTLTINSGATVKLSGAGGFGTTSGSRVGNTTITGGTLDIQNTGNNSITSASITLNGAAITGMAGSKFDLRNNGAGSTSVTTLASATTSTISVGTLGMPGNNTTFTVAAGSTASGIDLLISSNIVNDAGTSTATIAATNITKAGAGTLLLSGANTFTYDTNLNAGTLILASTGALQGSPLNLNGGTIVFDSSVASHAFSFGGLKGTGNLALVDNATTPAAVALTVTTATGSDVNYTGILSGSGSFTKTGNGTLTLSGANTYTGNTNASGGTLILTGSNTSTGTTGVSSAILRVGAGALASGQLSLGAATITGLADGAARTIANSIFFSSAGATIIFGDATAPGTLTFTGGVLTGTATSNRTLNTFVDTLFSGVLSGSNGSLIKSGTAKLTLSNTSSSTTLSAAGGFVVGGGIVEITRLANAGTNSSIGRTSLAATAASITVDGGTLILIDGSVTASSTDRLLQIGRTTEGGGATLLNNSANTLTFSNTNAIAYGTVDQARTITLGGTQAGANTLASAIGNNGAGVVSVTKQDTGAWVLSGTNTYTGATTVTGGSLQFGKAASFYGSTPGTVSAANAAMLTVQSGATAAFNVGGASDFTAADITTLLSVSNGSSGFMAGTYLGFDTTNASFTYADNITDTNGGTQILGVTKLGANSLTLSGSNTYSGGTRLLGGTLVVGSTSALGTGSVSVLANSSLTTSANFTNNIEIASGVTLSLTGGGFLTLGGVISGDGNITSSASTKVFGANTYTGTTTITGSFFCIDGDASFGAVPATFLANSITMTGGYISTFGAPSGTITLNANRGMTVTGSPGVDVSSGITLEIQGVISGTGGLSRNSNTGTLVLSGNNTYTGVSAVQVGTTVVSTIKNVGDTTGSSLGNVATVSAGTIGVGNSTSTGTLRYVGTGSITDRVINLGGTTGNAVLDQSGTGLLKFTSSLTATGAGSKTLTLTGSTAGTGELAGGIVDNSTTNKTSLIKSGTGTWTLSGANTYTGTTSVTGGVLQFATQASLYNNTTASWTAANLIVNSGAVAAFNVGGTGEFTAADINTLQGLTNVASGTAATQGFRNGSSIGLDTTNAAGAVFTYGSVLADHVAGTTTDTLGLRKLGSGTLQLTAINTYTGGTVVNGGTLDLAIGGGTGAIRGTLTVNSGAEVQVSVANGLGNTQNLRVTNTTLNGGTLDIQNTGTNSITSAVLTLNGGTVTGMAGSKYDLRDNGAGTTSVSVAASATTSVISVGTLGMPGNNPTFTVAAGTTASGVDLSISSVIVNNAGTGGAGGGVGNITKAGAGLMQLSGANTFTGTTTITAGTLALAGTGSTGTGAVTVQTNGTLLGTGSVRGNSFSAASGSTLMAGDSAALASFGTLSFTPGSGSGSFDFQSGSSVILGINPGGLSDLLNFDGLSAGTLTFNGNLQIVTATPYAPTAAETFNLLDWANVSNLTFASRYSASSYAGYLLGNGDDNLGLDLPDISGTGYAWDISQFTLNGTISTVIMVPEPGRAFLLLTGLGLLATRRRRAVLR